MPAALSCQSQIATVSKLFRNVPFLTSLEVSPFPVLLLSGSLALPGAQPCGARRAERLGRSAGQGHRRAGSPLVWTLSAVPRDGPPPATGDPPTAPTSAWPSADWPWWSARPQAPPRAHSAWRGPGSPATAARGLRTPWRFFRTPLHTPTPFPPLVPLGDSAARV